MTPDQLAELVAEAIARAVAPFKAHVAVLEERIASMRDRLALADQQHGELVQLRERVAVVEARPPIAGPAGRDGRDGVDGRAGQPGADGVGFDKVEASFDGDRTIALKFIKGDATTTVPIVLPIPKYQGVYQQAHAYGVGDVVTWAGSSWYCRQPTQAKPGDGASAWQLMVKRGRDGRDAERPA